MGATTSAVNEIESSTEEEELTTKPPLDLSKDIDFTEVTLKRDHMIFGQYLQIHKFVTAKTYQDSDSFKEARRDALAKDDIEAYKLQVLAQLADEADQHEHVFQSLF